MKSPPHQHQVYHYDPGRPHRRREEILQQKAYNPRGDARGQHQISHALVWLLEVEPAPRSCQSPPHPEKISAKEPDNGQHRPGVDRPIERESEPFLIYAQEVLA